MFNIKKLFRFSGDMQLSVEKESMRRLQSDNDHVSNENDAQRRTLSSGAGEGTRTAARRPGVREPAVVEPEDSDLACNEPAAPIKLEMNEPAAQSLNYPAVNIEVAAIKLGTRRLSAGTPHKDRTRSSTTLLCRLPTS